MVVLWIVVAVAVALLAYVVLTYNRLVRLRNEGRQGFANIESQLQRRADLIPNLVEVVKGYAAHESTTFAAVAAARSVANSATTPAEVAAADGQMQAATRGLMAVAEGYPQLQASENFRQLQGQLDTTESLIAQARRMYNVVVRTYVTALEQFPGNIVASMGRFEPMDFYRAEDDDRAVPAASFAPAAGGA